MQLKHYRKSYQVSFYNVMTQFRVYTHYFVFFVKIEFSKVLHTSNNPKKLAYGTASRCFSLQEDSDLTSESLCTLPASVGNAAPVKQNSLPMAANTVYHIKRKRISSHVCVSKEIDTV